MDATATPDALLALDAVLSEEERDAAAVVRRAVEDHVRPHVAGWWVDGALPVRELARLFGDLGLLGMHLDSPWTAGTTTATYGLACRELEAADTGVRSVVSVQGSLVMVPLLRFGSPEQQREWLPALAEGRAVGCFGLTEPDAGSDPAAMRTRARRDGSDWVLDGTKMWITNAPAADVAVVWARAEEGVRGFVVPTATRGVGAREVPGKLSMRASSTGELVLDGVRLPGDAVLPGVRGLRGPLTCLGEARFGVAWGVTGAMRDAIAVATRHALDRTAFGRSVAGFQLTQAKLADAVAAYGKAVLLALHLARVRDGGAEVPPALVSAAKYDNARAAIEVCRSMRTVLGGSGITADLSPLRHAANLETVVTYEGTQEVHQLVLGKHLTGLDAFS